MAQLLFPKNVRTRGIRQPIWPKIDVTHPINRGLVGYWPLDGQGSGLALDFSGFGNNGTPSNASLRDSHHGGNAFSFDGTSTNVVIPSNAAITGNNPRTFAAWTYLTSTSTLRAIFSYGGLAVGNGFVVFNNVNGTGDLYFAGNTDDWATSIGVVALNQWNHIAVTYNGAVVSTAGSILLYYNGVKQSITLQAGSSALNTTATVLHIGDDLNNAGRFFPGGIEAVRWYNRVLDPVEIAQLYAEPYAGVFDVAASLPPSTGILPSPALPLMGQIWLA